MGVIVRQRFQFRFQCLVHAGTTARRDRIRLPARAAVGISRRSAQAVALGSRWTDRIRGCGRNRRGHVHPRAAGSRSVRLEEGVVYHTYSAYSRGVDSLWAMYQWLDRRSEGTQRGRRSLVETPRSVRSRAAKQRHVKRLLRVATAANGAAAPALNAQRPTSNSESILRSVFETGFSRRRNPTHASARSSFVVSSGSLAT